MANDSASPTTDCIASVVSLGVHVIGRKRQVDCDGQKAGRKDALIGPLGGPSSYRPLSGRYLIAVMKIADSLFGMREDVLFIQKHLFIKKEKEDDPLVREFYIPSSHYVGYRYRIETRDGQAAIVDEPTYEDRQVTDDEFGELLKTVPHS